MTEHHALISLAMTLLGALVVSTWRFSSLATKLLEAVRRLEDKERQQDERLKVLDAVPELVTRVGHLEKNHSLIPKLESRTAVLEARQQHSAEMRRVMMRSRPDADEEG